MQTLSENITLYMSSIYPPKEGKRDHPALLSRTSNPNARYIMNISVAKGVQYTPVSPDLLLFPAGMTLIVTMRVEDTFSCLLVP